MLNSHSTQPRSGAIVAAIFGISLVLGAVRPSSAQLVAGGGSAKTDCFLEFRVDNATNIKKSTVTCENGQTCDADGSGTDTACTFHIALCPNQTNITKCAAAPPVTPQQKKGPTLTLPTDLSGTACGEVTAVSVPLKKNGRKKGALVIKFKTAGGTGKKDPDTLKLVCTPNKGGTSVCPAPASCASPCGKNTAGGPDEIDLSTAASGTDLDNGWTGISHNFPTPERSGLKMCLSTCDASTNPLCDACAPVGAGTINGTTFGPPLPLIASAVPVCVINEYNGSPWAKMNIQTGEVPSSCPVSVNLLSHVHFTQADQVCPRCTGAGAPQFGGSGRCDGGANNGKACTIDSIIVVAQSEGDTTYALSKDCPPLASQIAGTLDIALRLTTGTSTLTGSKPCTGPGGVAVQDDNCRGGACNAGCSGLECVKMVTDPVTGAPICLNSKGGLSQLCCAGHPDTSCFPSSAASGGAITRTGRPDPPAPVWPDPTYPKTSDKGVLVTTFCEGATTTGTINATTGLPGPGALILPGTQTLIKLP